mmetsp:Transcript_6104/g.9501  ORF Transcript_6104/g.9501 Transcript_6104/m.9501 type:complete len:337 (-) Transcript_6104:93-1103(-)|eukprot:CAMPEP_0201728164 /NCGR_PEP_ID=MMETSP0593-20130828/14950_1 /ASSEMBLY_ACC=CAM_ASM_000672 /TAXON_ID=267983 /ORGANISM="Skeletonema japonicum, Strain CCMP2506" /LENGTH=336 /DNA_ID=CAMNT_0048220187 /DNA_START=65 /DNA_END=1075 /DNA_ORIENTATION=-
MSASVSYSNPKHFNAYTGNQGSSVKSLAAKIKGGNTTSKSISNSSVAVATIAPTGGHQPFTLPVLHQKLTQYTRGSDRRQLLRLLTNPKEFPSSHVMKNVFVEDIAMAEREAAYERGALNGVKFMKVKDPTPSGEKKNNNEPMDSYFLQTLREICGHMCEMDGVIGSIDPMALYGGLLLRLCRSTSEKDALEEMTPLLARDELIVLPLKRRHHTPAGKTGGESKMAPPIDVELFVEAGDVHAKVTMIHEFGLFRKSDLIARGVNEHRLSEWSKLLSKGKPLSSNQHKLLHDAAFTNMKPWVFLDVDVIERINFGSGNNVRFLSVRVPDEKNSGYVR